MALASILDENNVDITMWTKFEDEKENLVKTRKNENGEDILMEHYHLVVSNKTPTGKEFKINE